MKKKPLLITELQLELGERKIDIVTASRDDKENIPLIIKIASETGIEV